jgi:hypothetical protein
MKSLPKTGGVHQETAKAQVKNGMENNPRHPGFPDEKIA